MKRAMWRFIAIIGVGALASIIVPVFVSPRTIPVWAYVIACMVPGLMMSAAGMWYGFATRKQVLRAARLQYRVCWNCGYHLRGLAESGSCPECGDAYTGPTLREKWGGAHDRHPSTTEGMLADDKLDGNTDGNRGANQATRPPAAACGPESAQPIKPSS